VVSVKEDIRRKVERYKQLRNWPKGGFYWERELYLSDAFLSLGKNSMKVLIAILDSRIRAKDNRGKYINNKFSNLDNLKMPYDTLENKWKISRGSIAPAFDALLEKGFLTIKKHGGIYRGDKTIYAWSDNWVIWRKGMVFEIRAKDVKRGYQGQGLGAAKNKVST